MKKNTPIQELQEKIDLLIEMEITNAMKNKVYEKIKISDLPQIQAYSYVIHLIETMDLLKLEKQNIIDAWEDMSEAKNGGEYYDINFK
jgi:hypothetical protein